MKKSLKSIISILVAVIMMVVIMMVAMPFAAYADSNKYDVYLKITYANGKTETLDAARNWRENNGRIINIYTDDFPITLELYRPYHWSREYTIYSYGGKTLDYQKFGGYIRAVLDTEIHGYVQVDVKSLAKKKQQNKAKAEKEALEKKNENFKKMLKNAGVESGYDWYIENDLNKFINGEWDGDRKSDSLYGDRYIIGRTYTISRMRKDYYNGSVYQDTFKCNLDYMGELEVNTLGESQTLAISKKNNKISCWQYFECLDQWDIPKTETITEALPSYCENYWYGTCKTKDLDGVEHLYILKCNGNLYKVY